MTWDIFPFLCLLNFFLISYSFSINVLLPWLICLNILVFNAIMNGIIFFISFPDNSFLCVEMWLIFLMLILYPETLLSSLIRYNGFFMESLKLYNHSTSWDNFTYFFLIWMAIISFSCLISLPRTSSTMLNRSGESEHTCSRS